MINDYMELMGREGRIILVNEPYTVLTFSICNDYRPYSEKESFEYLPHDPYGHICFIETMACKKWSRELLRRLEEAIVRKYPQLDCAVWIRPEGLEERKYYYRRRYYEASLRN